MRHDPPEQTGISGTKVVVVILIAIALMLAAAFYLWFKARDEFKRNPEARPYSRPL